MGNTITAETKTLIGELKALVADARKRVLKSINSEMVRLYFEIGCRIVENEQAGENRADYGKEILNQIAKELSKEFGKGFSATNLKQMRKFYMVYGKGQTLSDLFELPWSHYCELIKIEDITKRLFYERYAIEEGLSVRDLKRQIYSLFFERLALSKEKKGLIVHERGKFIPESPDETIKDPYILKATLSKLPLIIYKNSYWNSVKVFLSWQGKKDLPSIMTIFILICSFITFT